MAKRTSPADAQKISVAADLEELVQDKREGWRASGAKARRRQRRYKTLLTQQLIKLGSVRTGDEAMNDDVSQPATEYVMNKTHGTQGHTIFSIETEC